MIGGQQTLLNDKGDAKRLRNSKFNSNPWENESLVTHWKEADRSGGRRRRLILPVGGLEEFSDLPLLFMIHWNLVTSCWSPLSLPFPPRAYFLHLRKTSFLAFPKALCSLTPQYTCSVHLHCPPAWNAISPAWSLRTTIKGQHLGSSSSA